MKYVYGLPSKSTLRKFKLRKKYSRGHTITSCRRRLWLQARSSTWGRSFCSLRPRTTRLEAPEIPVHTVSQSCICKISITSDAGRQWHLFWTLVKQHTPEVEARLKESAKDAPNKGSVFRFDEFKVLLTQEYSKESGMPFPEWVNKRFLALCILLGALRSEQLNRFREGGLASIEFIKNNIGRDHF